MRFSIDKTFYEKVKDELQSFEDAIEEKGYITILSQEGEFLTKVYSPHLTLILTKAFIPGLERKNKIPCNFNGQMFFGCYLYHFEKGEQRFNDLYGKDIQRNAKSIYLNIPKNRKAARLIPEIISLEVVERIGHSAGWFSRAEETLADHPDVFKELE